MTKQKKYRIVADTENWFYVECDINGIGWTQVICLGQGQAGLEACEEWIAKQPEE